MPSTNSSEGTAVRPNIQRQPTSTYHDRAMNSSLAPAGRSRTIHQLTNCASRMPMTMVSWLIDTRRPRISAGATSAMYIGERLEASPMATPPSIRQRTKMAKLGARALPSEVTAKRIAHRLSKRLRPNRSLSAPASSAPTRQPNRAQLLAQPLTSSSVSSKYRSKNGLAPPMTTQS